MGNDHMKPITPQYTEPQLYPQNNVKSNDKEYDVFKDSSVRFLGYANEVGEAFRRQISRNLLIASYAISTSYVFADTIHKAHRSISKGETFGKSLISSGDTFVWHMLASIIIPGFVINRITYLTRRIVRLNRKKCICKASTIKRFLPVTVGLLAIPFVVKPIDDSITWLMDNTVRRLYSDKVAKKDD